MKLEAITTAIYAILVLTGGIMGYVMSGSLPSLVMGGMFAILLALDVWGLMRYSPTAYYLAFVLIGTLFAFFTNRFVMTGKFFPGGLMALLSVVSILILLFGKKLKN